MVQGALILPNSECNTRLQLDFGSLLKSNVPQDGASRVKYITITDTDIRLQVVRQAETNRLFLAHGAEQFAVVKFDVRFSSPKACAAYKEAVLINGVTISGQRYRFLGHSNSQLKAGACVLYRCGSAEQAAALLERWGAFGAIGSVAKRAKRIGLLFSTVRPALGRAQPPIRYKLIPDIERHGRVFTDGCGYCSAALAKRVARQQGIAFRGEPYVPSVLQIRYRGAKGTVQVAPALDSSPWDLLLRADSMVKFKEPPGAAQQAAVLGLVGASLPYKLGYLNLQTTMLLSALGVPDAAFERLQDCFFQSVLAMTEDTETAFKFLATNSQDWALLEHLAEEGIDGRTLPALRKLQRSEMEACRAKEAPGPLRPPQPLGDGGAALKGASLDTPEALACSPESSGVEQQEQAESELNEGEAQPGPPPATQARLRVLVDRSRLVYGVCDPTDDPALAEAVAEAAAAAAGHGGGGSSGDANKGAGRRPPAAAAEAAPRSRGSSRGGRGVPLEEAVADADAEAAPRGKGSGGDVSKGAGRRRPAAAREAGPAGGRSSGGGKSSSNSSSSEALLHPELFEPLQYGECFFQPTIDGVPTILNDTYVVVVRNPCYHRGDVLVLKCVDKAGCRHLVDCIVFPTVGHRPHADESSGGDLDGDKFFVCWEQALIPSRSALVAAPPYLPAPAAVDAEVGERQLIRYFAAHDSRLLGRLDAWYRRWAELRGPGCEECSQLAQLFARGVDSVTSGEQLSGAALAHLRPPDPASLPPEAAAAATGRVWNVLLGRAGRALEAFSQSKARGRLVELAEGLDYGGLMALMWGRDVCLSEFELLKLAAAWGRRQGVALAHLAIHIEFGDMSHLQRQWAVRAGVPQAMVSNALHQSELLSLEDMDAFELGAGHLHWKLWAAGGLGDPLAFASLHSALTQFTRKLLLVQVCDSQVLGFYLPQRLAGGQRTRLLRDLVVFVLAWSFKKKDILRQHDGWQAELTSTRLQVFKSSEAGSELLPKDQLGLSFLWLSAPQELLPREGGGGRGRGRGGAQGARSSGRGRGRSGGSGGSGGGGGGRAGPLQLGPAWTMRTSWAVADVDKRAFETRNIMKVTNEEVQRYELYVISERQPLQPHSLSFPGTAAAFWDPAPAGLQAAPAPPPGASDSEGCSSLASPEQPPAPEDLQALEQLLGAHRPWAPAVAAAATRLAAQLAAQDKLGPALQLLGELHAMRAPVAQEVWRTAMGAAARTQLCEAGAALVAWQLERARGETAGQTLADRLGAVVSRAASTGLLRACPDTCLLLWAALTEHGAAATLHPDAALHLLKAAMACAASEAEAAVTGLVSAMLERCTQLPRSAALLLDLLTSAVRCCTDRAAALHLLLPTVQQYAAAVTVVATAREGPPPGGEHSWQPGSAGAAVGVLRYVCHWAFLLTGDLLHEISETQGALLSAASAAAPAGPGAAALHEPALAEGEEERGAPPPTLLWDLISAKLHPPDAGEAAVGKRGVDSRPGGSSMAAPTAAKALTISGLLARPRPDSQQAQQARSPAAPAQQAQQAREPAAAVLEQRAASGSSDTAGIACTVGAELDASATSAGLLSAGAASVVMRLSRSGGAPLAGGEKLQGGRRSVEGMVVGTLVTGVDVELPWKPSDLQGRLWRLQRLGNLTTYLRCLSCLGSLARGQALPDHLQLVLDSWLQPPSPGSPGLGPAVKESPAAPPTAVPTAATAAATSADFPFCNASQSKAIQAALAGRMAIIHGPPGTGKTHTIAHLLVAALQRQQAGALPGGPILVTAGTHVAVDNCLTKLLRCLPAEGPTTGAGCHGGASSGGGAGGVGEGSLGVREGGGGGSGLWDGMRDPSQGLVLRVGDVGNLAPEVRRFSLEAREEVRSAHSASGLDARRAQRALRSARLVFATCAGAGSQLLARCTFSMVVVDEASQVVEPCALIPLTARGAERCVLVGDHRQLGPCTTQYGQARGLDVSLFERLQGSPLAPPPLLLNLQYRMHPAISAFPNQHFYGGRLLDGPGTRAAAPPPPLPAPVVFVPVPEGRESMGPSKCNLREAEAVVRLMGQLLSGRSVQRGAGARGSGGSSSGRGGAPAAAVEPGAAGAAGQLGPGDVGVITPYKAQAERLQRQLAGKWPGLEVNTVDAFQGREKQVIIVSTVRANPGGHLGFVTDRRRMNVALTRAVRALVLVGHEATLAADSLWGGWVRGASRMGAAA